MKVLIPAFGFESLGLGIMIMMIQAENAPELNTPDSIFKSVSVCSPEIEFAKV